MEELATAYPMLDRNMIQIAIEFDEQMQEKYGEDYRWEDHMHELIPRDDLISALSSETTEPESSSETSVDDGQGQDSTTSA